MDHPRPVPPFRPRALGLSARVSRKPDPDAVVSLVESDLEAVTDAAAAELDARFLAAASQTPDPPQEGRSAPAGRSGSEPSRQPQQRPAPARRDRSGAPPPAELRFVLGWPESTNRIWRSVWTGGRARVVLSPAARAYRERVAYALLAQGLPRLRLAVPVAIHILARPPANGRVRDLDNLLKSTLDAIVRAGLLADDRYVDVLEIRRGPPAGVGSLEVTLHALET